MKNGGHSPCPDEPDIRISVELAGVRMYFAACLTAALVFVCDVTTSRPGTVTVYPRSLRRNAPPSQRAAVPTALTKAPRAFRQPNYLGTAQ